MTTLARLQRQAALAFMHGRVWLGSMGAAGLLLLAIAIGAAVWALQLTEEATALQAQVETEGARRQDRLKQRELEPDTQLLAFRDGLPDTSQYLADLRAIFRIAHDQQVELARGDYASARRAYAGLAAHEVILPMKTNYTALRAFIAGVLNVLPNASLVELRLERAQGDQLNARIHLTLYYRES